MRRAGTRTPRQRAGDAAEALAERFLAGHGLTILERNFRCKGGEIDLVARDGGTLVFVEVRLRRSAAFGGAAASIDARKRARVLHAARVYLGGRADLPCRCDAVVLDAVDPARVEWLRDAFGE